MPQFNQYTNPGPVLPLTGQEQYLAAQTQSGSVVTVTVTGQNIVASPLPGYTVATLPAGTAGARAYVSDATSPTFLSTLTGGGTTVCPVFYNGSAWVAG